MLVDKLNLMDNERFDKILIKFETNSKTVFQFRNSNITIIMESME